MNVHLLWRAIEKSPMRVLFGVTISFVAVVLLVWNEGHAVRTSRSLNEGHELVESIAAADPVSESNDGKVIHLSGPLATAPALTDPDYNIEIEAVRLKRRVQMYQWVEHTDTNIPFESEPVTPNAEQSSDVSYSYSMEWKDKVIDSFTFNIPFGHENPKSFPLKSYVRTADVVKIGHFYLSEEIVRTITSFEPFSGDEEPATDRTKLHGGMYYHCKDLFDPAVGDTRVQFYYAGHSGDLFSIIGIQRGSQLLPYTSSSGQEIVLLHTGQKTPEEMFAHHHAHTRLYNWGLRMTGFFILCVAIAIMNDVPYVAVGLFPAMRDLRAMSGGHFTLTIAMSLSLLIIALSWCVYKPVMALILLAVSLLPLIKSGYRHR